MTSQEDNLGRQPHRKMPLQEDKLTRRQTLKYSRLTSIQYKQISCQTFIWNKIYMKNNREKHLFIIGQRSCGLKDVFAKVTSINTFN